MARDLYRGRSSIAAIKDGMLIWKINTKRGGQPPVHGSISLRSIQALELVFPRERWHGKNSKDYNFVDAFLVDAAGKRHQIPDALMPGVYYKKILKAIREIKPDIVLNEKFDDPAEKNSEVKL